MEDVKGGEEPTIERNIGNMISMNVKVAHHSLLNRGCFLSMGVCFGANIHLKHDQPKVF